jgi:hypothetical protein
MKFILFCQNNYAYGILNPIKQVIIEKKYSYLWYIPKKLVEDFPHKDENHSSSMSELAEFKSDIIFVPGNQVPYYLRGLKVQVFHGFAGEKKGHFKIRHYFDLYLTQGPFFTKKFKSLQQKHKNFEVIETGWPKLDVFAKNNVAFNIEKENLLKKYNAETIILYAPTFSPKLTSAPYLGAHLKQLAQNKNYLIVIKFHPLMDLKWIETYRTIASKHLNIIIQEDKNIAKLVAIADLMISDTSSAIYEFLLLNKPVVSFGNISKNILWENSKSYSALPELVSKNLQKDPFAEERKVIFDLFHPYNDGKSAERMVDASIEYINKHGIPNNRKLPYTRTLKINAMFGAAPSTKNKPAKLTALITCGNEIHNIEAVIKSVDFADEILVADSYSSDGTYEKALEMASKVIRREYEYAASQKNWAIPQASHEWILLVDADERVTPELREEILSILKNPPSNIVGYWIGRRNYFMGKRIYYSGWKNDKVIRLFKGAHCRYEDKYVHEEINASGAIGSLYHKFEHNTFVTLNDYIEKMNRYADYQAKDYDKKTGKLNPYHFVLKPIWRFLKHYFIQGGFLDGVAGLSIAYIQSYAVFMRYVKLWLLRKGTK